MKRITIAAIALLLLAGCRSGTQMKCKWEVKGYSFNGISRSYCVGDGGIIMHRNKSGWKKERPVTNAKLNAVCERGNFAWAVGDDGTILFKDGSEWVKQESGTKRELNSVVAVDDLVLACGRGVILSYDGSWKIQRRGREELNGIHGLSPDDIWAVGSNGTVLHWNGRQWDKENISMWEIKAVQASKDGVWACGTMGRIYHHESGWKLVRTGGELLNGIMVKGGSVWFAGYVKHGSSPDWGSVLIEHDGGWHRSLIERELYPTGIATSDGEDFHLSGLSGIAGCEN